MEVNSIAAEMNLKIKPTNIILFLIVSNNLQNVLESQFLYAHSVWK